MVYNNNYNRNGKIVVRVFAGLGNQQFQYAFAKALSLKYNKELALDSSYFLHRYHPIKNQGFYYPYKLDEFDLKENKTNIILREIVGLLCRHQKIQKTYQFINNYLMMQSLPMLVTDDNFLEELLSKNKTFLISGYFQKHSTFEEFADIIRKDLTYCKELTPKNTNYLQAISSENTVSIHVRRGDYVEKKHVLNTFARISPSYFDCAVRYIADKINIKKLIIFSDDIEWVKKKLSFDYNCIYIDNNGPDYQHQYLMSQCNHNIISNSTYSWWGAWLNPNKEKIVCVPEKWYENENRKNDIYIPNNWIKINNN